MADGTVGEPVWIFPFIKEHVPNEGLLQADEGRRLWQINRHSVLLINKHIIHMMLFGE